MPRRKFMLLVATLVCATTIKGQVFLSNGKPAANAFIANQSFGQGSSRGFTDRIACDDKGRFVAPIDSRLLTRVFQVFSKDLKESYLDQTQSNSPDPRIIHLKPSSDVTIRFKASGEAGKGSVAIQAMPTLSLPWGGDMDEEGIVRVILPQGEYKVNVRSDDNDFAQYTLNLKGGPQEFKVEGQLNPFGRLRGQPAPELEIQESMGVPRSTSIKDYRGKYVLLEFWGYWCAPCIESSIPSLIRFEKDNPGIRSKLVILTIHENSSGLRTMSEIQRKLPAIERQFWGGPLPFPILLEKPKSLTKTFGIRAYPTAVLIDPEGKIVDRADVGTLQRTLRSN